MQRITQAQILKIIAWRNTAAQACLACEQALNALNITADLQMTIGQAKAIVEWDIRFMRLKIQMAQMQSLRNNVPLAFSSSSIETLDRAKEAIAHGRKNIIGDKLNRAIAVLQRAGTIQTAVPSFYAEGAPPSVTDSDVNETVSETFKEGLHDNALQKKQKTEYIVQLLKTHATHVRQSHHKTTPTHKTQLGVNRLIMKFHTIDEAVLQHARSNIKSQYENIRNNHEALEVWLEIIKEAYAIANKNLDVFLEKINAQQARRDKIKEDVMKGFVALALSPFSLNNFAGPLLQIATGMFSQVGLYAQKMIEAQANNESTHGIPSATRKQFFAFLAMIGHAAETEEKSIKKIDEMREKSPIEFVDLMKQYSAYKLNGFAKEMSQAFDANTTIWNKLTPEEVIRSQRMKLIRAAQVHMNQEEWRDAQADRYKQLLETIEMDLKNQFDQVSDSIFSDINKQYPDRNDIIQIQGIIKLLIFDEKSSGINAIKTSKRNELIHAMADQIEIHMVMKYAAVYSGYFGGNDKRAGEHIALLSKQAFDPYENSHFGLKPNHEAQAIIDYLIKKTPQHKATLEPLKQVGFLDYIQCLWELKTTEKHQSRKDALNFFVQEYANSDMSTKLKTEVFKFAKNNHIDLPQKMNPAVKHEWVAEQDLRDNAHRLLSPLIREAEQYGALTSRQCRLTQQVLTEQVLVKSVPSALDHQAMEGVPNARSLLKV